MNSRQKIVQKEFLKNEEAVIKRLKQVYTQSLKDINQNIEDLMSRTDSDQQYVIYQVEYQKALKRQINGILDTMEAEQFKTVSEYLTKCYDEGFVGTMYDLQGQGIPLVLPIDQEQLVRAVQLDSKISNGLYSRMGEDVSMLKKHITAQVSRGISTGMSFEQVAQQISFKMVGTYNTPGGSLAKAMRIARTEGHRIQVQAGMDACYRAKEKGADVVKQWDATLDSSTRESHQQVDGEIRELDEKFSNGLMFPGDPSGGAAEVVNCRCALLQRARWALGETELQTLKDRASYFGLDKSKDFESYREKYIQVTKDAVKTVPKFSPAKTIAEAEAFIKQYVDDSGFGALGVSYQGISVDVANELNKAISNFYETFDVQKFGGILAPAGNTKLGQKITGATAAYSPVRNSFLVNRKSMKDMKTAVKSFQAEKDALQLVLEHPERFDFSKFSRTLRETIERSKVSGRATVPESIEEAIHHELGHMMERKVYQSPLWDDVVADMPKYADKISGYAGSDKSEYVAESFASYLKGEKLCDPNLVRIFESLKR